MTITVPMEKGEPMGKITVKWVGMVTMLDEVDESESGVLPLEEIQERAKTIKDMVKSTLENDFDVSITIEQQFCDVWRTYEAD